MINEIKEALEKATPGIWCHYQSNKSVVVGSKDSELNLQTIASGVSFNDGHLIANAPTYLRYLIDELELPQQSSQHFGESIITPAFIALQQELEKAKKDIEVHKYAHALSVKDLVATVDELEKANKEVKRLKIECDKWDAAYDELHEQAMRWQEESGN